MLPGKEKVVAELQKLAEKADTVYLASDLDREGEAIAWHLQEIIGGEPDKFKRVVFNEITKTAIAASLCRTGHRQHQPGQRPANPSIPRPYRWLYGIPAVVEESRPWLVCRAGSVCGSTFGG